MLCKLRNGEKGKENKKENIKKEKKVEGRKKRNKSRKGTKNKDEGRTQRRSKARDPFSHKVSFTFVYQHSKNLHNQSNFTYRACN
jgi:hypothetical protein